MLRLYKCIYWEFNIQHNQKLLIQDIGNINHQRNLNNIKNQENNVKTQNL